MEEFDTKVFAQRFMALRKSKGLTHNVLAVELKISNAIISDWENGNVGPTATNLFKIAKYFGVTSDYLIGLSDF